MTRWVRTASSTVGVVLLVAACSGRSGDRIKTAEPGTVPLITLRDPSVVPGPGADPGSGKSISVRSVPASVRPGEVATATFAARPGSTCQLEFRTPGAGPKTQRLAPVTADPAGQVSWSWTVEPDTPRGDAGALVVCSGGGRGQARITIA